MYNTVCRAVLAAKRYFFAIKVEVIVVYAGITAVVHNYGIVVSRNVYGLLNCEIVRGYINCVSC
ncbi:hypothetical protein ES703_31158 [subsurface metagenome]